MTVRIQTSLTVRTSGFTQRFGHSRRVQQAAEITGAAAFEGWAEQVKEATAIAVTGAIAAATEGLKSDLRRAVRDGGLGEKLPNAVRSEVYPKGGASAGAAGWIYVKGKRTLQILEAYAQGTVIRAKGGRWLAIPTPAAGQGSRGSRMTPSAWKYQRGIKLRFVQPRGWTDKALLIAVLRRSKARSAAGLRRTGGYRNPTPAALRRGDTENVIVFVLVRQVRVPKRISIEGLGDTWIGRVLGLIDQLLGD